MAVTGAWVRSSSQSHVKAQWLELFQAALYQPWQRASAVCDGASISLPIVCWSTTKVHDVVKVG